MSGINEPVSSYGIGISASVLGGLILLSLVCSVLLYRRIRSQGFRRMFVVSSAAYIIGSSIGCLLLLQVTVAEKQRLGETKDALSREAAALSLAEINALHNAYLVEVARNERRHAAELEAWASLGAVGPMPEVRSVQYPSRNLNGPMEQALRAAAVEYNAIKNIADRSMFWALMAATAWIFLLALTAVGMWVGAGFASKAGEQGE